MSHRSSSRRQVLRGVSIGLGTVLLAGCIGDDDDGDDGDTPPADTVTFDSVDHDFEGTDSDATDTVDLDSGVVMLTAKFTGQGTHQVDLVRDDGTAADGRFVQVANEYLGQQAASVSGGEYQLDVSAAGSWRVGITELTATDPDTVPISVADDTHRVIGPIEFADDDQLSAETDGGFLHATIHYDDGQTIHAIQNLEGSDDVTIGTAGVGWVEVRDTESWSVELS